MRNTSFVNTRDDHMSENVVLNFTCDTDENALYYNSIYTPDVDKILLKNVCPFNMNKV